ncbi:MAG: hypothetical protein V7K27_28045 [Nostoc sp.]
MVVRERRLWNKTTREVQFYRTAILAPVVRIQLGILTEKADE